MTSVSQGQSGGDAVAQKQVDFTYNTDGQENTVTQYADAAATEQVDTGTNVGRMSGLIVPGSTFGYGSTFCQGQG